jgi:response regulator RpfG family c-di-GMP phosphodiesterase
VQEIFIAGLLHDVSLLATCEPAQPAPGDVVARPEAMRRRDAAQSARILSSIDEMQHVAALVGAHHERFDGGGFPQGLSGDSIPLGARILSLASTVDTQLHGVAGVPLCTADGLIERLRQDRGACFDPRVVEAFVPLIAGAVE